MRTALHNATVLDTSAMTFAESQTVVIEDGLIVAVDSGSDSATARADIEIDAAGRYVLPGLIDAHVHFRLATLNFHQLSVWTEVEFGVTMATLTRNTVERGFTTVRDLGGDLRGLIRAIDRGAAVGPRIVKAGRMLTQTGGHGDTRGSSDDSVPSCGCSLHTNWASIVADGPDAVRKAARHNLRDGSDFLKIHVSGGVASPTDPLESVQYTPAEIEAAVTEASHRNTYVAAHAYTPEAITMAVTNGVHTIEHGNLIDGTAASEVAEAGSVMVPTLVTYQAMGEFGERLGMPASNLAKNARVLESGLASIETALSAGVTLGLGTDLIGETQGMQNQELAIRAQVQPAEDVLRSMWIVNAELCHLAGRIGVLAPGAFGDVVISTVNPLVDLASFANHEQSISHVIQGGIVVVERSA